MAFDIDLTSRDGFAEPVDGIVKKFLMKKRVENPKKQKQNRKSKKYKSKKAQRRGSSKQQKKEKHSQKNTLKLRSMERPISNLGRIRNLPKRKFAERE